MSAFDDLDRAVQDRYADNPRALNAWTSDSGDHGRHIARAYYDVWTGNTPLSWAPTTRANFMRQFWTEMERFGVDKFDGTFDWKRWKQEYEAG